jgi:hypothetical protein
VLHLSRIQRFSAARQIDSLRGTLARRAEKRVFVLAGRVEDARLHVAVEGESPRREDEARPAADAEASVDSGLYMVVIHDLSSRKFYTVL